MNLHAASFWRRYCAYCIDLAIVLLLISPVLIAIVGPIPDQWQLLLANMDKTMQGLIDQSAGDITLTQVTLGLQSDPNFTRQFAADMALISRRLLESLVIVVMSFASYSIFFEASTWAATPGKRLLQLRVCAPDGQRLSVWRCAARFGLGTLNWLTLNLGHARASFHQSRRALHDVLSKTCVVQVADEDRLPGWARAFLTVQFSSILGGFLYVLVLWLISIIELARAGLL